MPSLGWRDKKSSISDKWEANECAVGLKKHVIVHILVVMSFTFNSENGSAISKLHS